MTKLRSQWDRVLAAAAAAAGAVVLVIGWYGVSGTAYPAEQMPYIISAGMGGLFLLGIASALWLSADLHDEWRKLDRIEQAIREAELDSVPVGNPDVAGAEAHAPERTSERASVTGRLPVTAVEGAR